MRCPECSQRNSVAAKKCAACGSTLRRKPMPIARKAVIGILLAAGFVVCLANLSNALIDPEKALTNTATTLTSKATSAKQMIGNIQNFDHAMRRFLEKYGTLETNVLNSKLSFCLPKTLYEAHVFDLLPNLKLVEIDTALNASNYLILLSNGKSEVLPIIGLDVYDSNSFLPQIKNDNNKKTNNEGQLLVLLGHSTDIHGHHPRVKVLLLSSTLQSDNVVDISDKAVPKLAGEGSAKFSPNQKDIELSISLHSRGEELELFAANQPKSSLPIENESLYEQLIWQNNAYLLKSQSGTSKMYALYAVASALKNHNKLVLFHNLSPTAKRTIEQVPVVTNESGFVITAHHSGKRSANTNNIYELRNDSTKAIVELRPNATGKRGNGLSWCVNSLTIMPFKSPSTLATAAAPKITEIISQPKATEEKPKVAEEKPKSSENKITAAKTITEKTPAAQPKISKALETNKTTAIASTSSNTQSDAISSSRNTIKLRSGPSTAQPSIYDIKPNSPLNIIGKDNGWYKVKVDGKEGFVYAGLINAGKSGGYISKTAKQSGLVRDEEKKVIGNTSAGEHLVLLGGLKNNRYKIVLSNGKTGYVYKDVIDGGPAKSSPTNAPPPSVP